MHGSLWRSIWRFWWWKQKGMGRDRAAAVAAVTVWWLVGCAGAVWLQLATTATKCLSEDIQSNVVVIGDYSILYEEQPVCPKVSAKVVNRGLAID
jgi:p24 family protein delta-1